MTISVRKQECTNNIFIQSIFGTGHGNVLATGFRGDPGDVDPGVWTANTWDANTTWDPDANNYVVVSTFSDHRRKKLSFQALHLIMLDDIILCDDHVGGKVSRASLPAAARKPTWVIETSHGNAQVGLKLDKPITKFHIANRLIDGIKNSISPGKDPGQAGVTRYFKLPQGVNGKAGNGHVNNLKVWQPDKVFSLEELCSIFELDYEAVIADPATPKLTEVSDHTGSSVENAVDWYCSEVYALKYENEEKWEITCPWVENHTEKRDDGCCVGKPGSHPEIPGYWFKCQHTTSCGDDRKLNDFMRYCREAGFTERTTPEEDFAEYKQEVPKTPGFSTFSYDSIDNTGTPPRQLVEDVLVYGEMTLISAQPNTGKSAFALDLAEYIAAGDVWQGRQVEQSSALYICAESPATIEARMLAIKARRGGSIPLHGTYDPISLSTPAERRMFSEKLDQWLVAVPDTNIIIIDTFRSATPGISESDQESAGPVINYIHNLAKTLRRHIVLIHHMTKSGAGYSGTGQFGSQVDTEMVIWDETELDGETDGHPNRGCLVAHIRQQRGLATKHTEYMYEIISQQTGRINNFGKHETAPVVNHLSDADLELRRLEVADQQAIERAEAVSANLDAVVAAMDGGCTNQVDIRAVTGLSQIEVRAACQAGAEDGCIIATGSGNGIRYSRPR